MQQHEKLAELCEEAMSRKNLDSDIRYKKRLALELKEIDNQNEASYFLGLVDKRLRYPTNENNLLVPYLLGVVPSVEIDKEPDCTFGDFPDVDVDYLPIVRDYLKNEWAPKQYGQEFVCNIGSYNTFGIKSSLQDMARVLSKSRSEIMDLTTAIGLKDEDGKVITWDKALKMYPALKAYCEANPDVADAAKRLLHRNRSMGKHAGGLIVSSVPIDEMVPLVKGKDGTHVSAWVEGLHGQDLGPMGLVKFDLLVITNILQRALCCELIKKRYPKYKASGISALPGQPDFTDTAFLNDSTALAMASAGDLKCIFQFDSEGIRSLAKQGGVDSFDDLAAYTALFRPGPLGMKMQERYIQRKRGNEEYTIHPILLPILGSTYGVLVYQEQVMQVLNVVGDIPLKDCEIIRKAISKKKEDYFLPYKKMFVENGQRILGWTEEEVVSLWDQIAAFAEYGFNKSHAYAYTYISSQLLYLKAHFPLEFFTAILMCEDLAEKVKEYKVEARRYGIEIKPLDLNKSGVNFQIVDNEKGQGEIYYGFGNVKGIGKAVAENIVQHQPYNGVQEFLDRCTLDANTLKPLVGLGVFGGESPTWVWKYCNWYKDRKIKLCEGRKRTLATCQRYMDQLQQVVPPEYRELADIRDLTKLLEVVPEGTWHQPDGLVNPKDERGWNVRKTALDLQKKFRNAIETRRIKEEKERLNPSSFDPATVDIDEKLAKIYALPETAQQAYYGFLWTHPLEKLPNYRGMTFEWFRQNPATAAEKAKYVEVRIDAVDKRESKKNKGVFYWCVKCEDANGEIGYVNVWSDDWQRFGDELRCGNLIRMQVKPPSGGFKTYSLYSPPQYMRNREIPKDKESDVRVVVLRENHDTIQTVAELRAAVERKS